MSVTLDPQKRISSPTSVPARRRSRWWIWLLILLMVGFGIYWLLRPAKEAPGGPGGFGGRHGPPTFVSVEAARQADLPDYVTALGTAVALNTSVVHSRVDGQLIKVDFDEGQDVKEGDLLAEIDPRSFQVALQQAQGQLARDQALLSNAKLDLQRYENASEAVTQQQVDAAKSAVAQYEGTVKADEGTVANAELQLSFCHVTAPISGRTGLRQIDVGNLVHSSDANGIVTITQVKPIAIRFNIPEDNLSSVTRAMNEGTSLQVEVKDRSMRRTLAAGKLAAVDNQIDTTTGTVRLKALAPNDDLALFPNQFVNVRLLVNVEKNATLVPTSALQINGAERYLYVVADDSTVKRRTVKTGNTEGIYTAITDGLSPGEKVVTEGLDRLQDGMKVQTRVPEPAGAAAEKAKPAADGKPHGPYGGKRRHRSGGDSGSGQ
jgi:membrane fusion protein, multidrug efflux system